MAMRLTPELQGKIDQMMESGDFPDAESVVEASLRLLEEQRQGIEWLRSELKVGEEQDLSGDTIRFDGETMKRLIAESEERSRLGLPISDAVTPKY